MGTNPTTAQYTLYALITAFLFCLLMVPAFARSVANFLLRHAAAVEAAYRGYADTWNGWEDSGVR